MSNRPYDTDTQRHLAPQAVRRSTRLAARCRCVPLNPTSYDTNMTLTELEIGRSTGSARTLKWHVYDPFPVAGGLQAFLSTVERDLHGCFWG
jgi:hypothetical protein